MTASTAPPDEGNLRARWYLIARGVAVCGTCRTECAVAALVLPPGHQRLDDAEGMEETARLSGGVTSDDPGRPAWQVVPHTALVFHLERIGDGALARLRQHAPSFRRVHGEPGRDGPWSNHCARCAAPFEDHDLFCEPGGAFCPEDESAARRVLLEAVDETVIATAGGCVDDALLPGGAAD